MIIPSTTPAPTGMRVPPRDFQGGGIWGSERTPFPPPPKHHCPGPISDKPRSGCRRKYAGIAAPAPRFPLPPPVGAAPAAQACLQRRQPGRGQDFGDQSAAVPRPLRPVSPSPSSAVFRRGQELEQMAAEGPSSSKAPAPRPSQPPARRGLPEGKQPRRRWQISQ